MSSDDAPAGKSGSAGRRRREVAGSHDVQLVTVQPPVKDGRLRTAIFATDQGHIKYSQITAVFRILDCGIDYCQKRSE